MVLVVAAFEAPAVVAGLDDVTVMGQPVEQRGGHLGVAEDAGPFTEGEVRGDDDRRALVEPADEMEQELAAGLSEGQVAEFIEDDEVEAGQLIGEPTLPPVAGLGLQSIDQIHDVVEPATRAGADAASGDGNGEVSFAGAGPTDQYDVALLSNEAAAGEIMYEGVVDRRPVELEVVEVLGERQLGDGELVLDGARLLLADLGFEQIADDVLRLVLAFDAGGQISSKAAFIP